MKILLWNAFVKVNSKYAQYRIMGNFIKGEPVFKMVCSDTWVSGEEIEDEIDNLIKCHEDIKEARKKFIEEFIEDGF